MARGGRKSEMYAEQSERSKEERTSCLKWEARGEKNETCMYVREVSMKGSVYACEKRGEGATVEDYKDTARKEEGKEERCSVGRRRREIGRRVGGGERWVGVVQVEVAR
jgi:hypothetical protein